MLVEAGHKFGRERLGRMSAAIAYRTVFALAPLLIIAVSVVGLVLGSSVEAQQEIIQTISDVAGEQVAAFFESFLASALSAGDTAAIIGFALLFWFASSLFLEMQNDLNDIFHVPYEHTTGLILTAKKRVIGFLWALGFGLSVVLVLLINSVWALLERVFPQGWEVLYNAVAIAGPLVSLVVLPLIFALMFQTMTSVSVPWRAVWWGGLFTALVFIIAAYGISFYFQLFGEPTALGFASSVVVVLFLAYMLSSVFLFGAAVTKVYSDYLAQSQEGPSENLPGPGGAGVVVDGPSSPLERTAVIALLVGVALGWRRSRP
jgi:membrane protein